MEKLINFVVPVPPAYLSLYQKVLASIIDPIRIHLPESIVSPSSISDAVNIHFFSEGTYFEKNVNQNSGINVYMSHGMGDKQLRDGPRVKRFDYICVSGPRWVEKMIKQGIPFEKVIMNGFPKLDPLFQGLIKKNGSHTKKTVVYAPTHYASAPCTSYPAFKEFLDQFPKDLEILSCAHPYHRKENKPVLQELADADVVIADGSSVIYEALALGKPVVFPDWLVKDAILTHWSNSFTAQIYREKIGYHATNFEHMVTQIYEAIDKKLTDKDKTFIDGILPPQLRGSSGKATAETLKKLAY